MNLRAFLLLLLAGSLLAACGSDEPRVETTDAVQASDDAHVHDGEVLYTCSMHPQIVESEPGQCPICGMDLTPIQPAGSGDGVVEIDPATIQNIGVRTATVDVRALDQTTRTSGTFQMDERTRTVTLKYAGWIETLHADYDGIQVRKGQPLMEVYSPELVSTQEEYLLALRNLETMRSSTFEGAVADAERLVEAARRRLLFWDISPDLIDRLAESGEPRRTVTIYAPATGIVRNKQVSEGEFVAAGQPVLEIEDDSRVWLIVDVNEQDLSWVRPGTRAEILLPYSSSPPIEARIDYVFDHLDHETRTARARIQLPNRDDAFRAGQYATVTLYGASTEPRPVVPDEALLRADDQTLVILALNNGRFAPVEVETGLQAGGQVQITRGLIGGERIVTSAQFLIDSEARLRSAVGSMTAGTTEPVAQDAAVKSMLVDVYAADTDGDGHIVLCEAQPHLMRDTAGPIADCPSTPVDVTIGTAQAVLRMMGYTNVPIRVDAIDRDGDGFVYQSPMHWSVMKDAPGNCDVCNMRLDRVTVAEARANLEREGYQPLSIDE